MGIKQKIINRVANNLRPVVDKVGEQLYNQLMVVTQNMNISFNDLIDSTSDYNSFWELVAKYYNDYVDMEEYENGDN